MAGLIDVGLIKPELAGAFAAGYRGADVARQQAQQAEQQLARGRQQMELDQMTIDRLKEDRKVMLDFQAKLKAIGQDPDLDKLFDAMIATGRPDYMTQGLEGKKRYQDQKEFARIMGLGMPTAAAPAAAPTTAPMGAAPAPSIMRQPMAAPAAAPAPLNVMGTGLFGVYDGARPTNALAAAGTAAAAPAVPATPVSDAGAPSPLIAQTQARINNLMQFAATASTPQVANNALAQARILQDQLELYSKRPANAPASLQELEAYMKMSPEQKAAFERLQKIKSPSQTVTLPPQEKAFETQLGKEQAERIVKSQAAAKDAAGIIDTVKIGRDIMKSGMITGAGAEFFVNLNQALKTAGIDAGYADAAANSQAFAANMAGNVGRIIKQFGAGTGLSNADREYAEKMAGGKINLDADAIRRILDINERAARNVIRAHNKDVKNIKTNIPLTVEEPPEASASLSEQDRQALDWANKNPRDPRAAEIKKRLGM